jgi:protein TonB
MKIRMTTSFFYSLVLHLTVLVLALLLFWMAKSDADPVREKRCRIMLNQVCECPPEQAVRQPAESKKEKKPKAETKVAKPLPEKRAPAPVVEEKAVLQDAPKVVEVKNEAEFADEAPLDVVQEEVKETADDDQQEEPTVTPATDAVQAPAAQQAVEMPLEEHVSPEDAYIEAHMAEIMALLRDNLYYPRMARKRHIEGKVTVRFELLKNGEIENITVVEAERDILARSAVTTIERLDGKFPLPSERLILNVPIMYNLH